MVVELVTYCWFIDFIFSKILHIFKYKEEQPRNFYMFSGGCAVRKKREAETYSVYLYINQYVLAEMLSYGV